MSYQLVEMASNVSGATTGVIYRSTGRNIYDKGKLIVNGCNTITRSVTITDPVACNCNSSSNKQLQRSTGKLLREHQME